jgi:thioredoxin 1
MAYSYLPESLNRDEVDALAGVTVLQFGTDWCGYCRAAEPAISAVLAEADGVRHLLIEDGKGRPLGRSFQVKLWPTLVFLADGAEVARVVRPWGPEPVAEALAAVRAQAAGPADGA